MSIPFDETRSGRMLTRKALNYQMPQLGKLNTFIVEEKVLQEEVLRAEIQRAISSRVVGQRVFGVGQVAAAASQATEDFCNLFQHEVLSVSSFVSVQFQSLKLSAKKFLNSIGTEDIPHEELRRRADDHAFASLKLEQFATKNWTILVEIAVFADEQLGTNLTVQFDPSHERTSIRSVATNGSSALIVVLSDIYEAIRSAKLNDLGNATKWVAPSHFERVTNKFWVQDDSLTEVLLQAVTEVPLLVYGRTGRLTAKCNGPEGENTLWGSLATRISSVYFDNPDSMVMYRERLKRREGARLFRVRWYGKKRPVGKEPLFLELKTHHEKWVCAKSTKERVTIQAEDIYQFLSPNSNWSLVTAETIIRKASPQMDNTKAKEAAALIVQMQRLVRRFKLRPLVRSVYTRAAFQSASSNALRVTVDRDITLIDETNRFTKLGCKSDDWCLPDNAVLSRPEDVVRVPYAVLEVKTCDRDEPDFVSQMLHSGTILDAAKFSKFLTGAAALNTAAVDAIPYWAQYPAFVSLFDQSKSAPEHPSRTQDDNFELRQRSKVTSATDTDRSGRNETTSGGGVVNKLIGYWFGARFNKYAAKKIAPKKAVRVEPKSYFANERTFIQWISASLLLVTVSVLLKSFSKEEPYSYAAQRVATVGQVLNLAAATVVFYSGFVYYRRIKRLQNGSAYGYVDLFGPLLLGAAILVGIVVMLVYFIYADKVQWDSWSSSSTPKSLYEEPGRCTKHKTAGLNRLTDQPSDLLVDPTRQVLLIPSLSEIRAFPKVTSQDIDGTLPPTVVSIPGADIEGLTYGGNGNIYAVSEVGKEGKSELFSLTWTSSSRLQVVSRWDIPTMNAEGIAYIPSTDGSFGKLVIGGDNPGREVSGEMAIYDETILHETTDGVTAISGRPFNGRVLAEGLSEAKIGALLYFEGLLYVLHDNARVVRVWDIDEGILHSQWSLPMVAHGYDKMWEGMYLERIPTTSGTEQLRGSKRESSLILHLALDTPPEVWSFSVEEGDSPGSIILPSCAAGTA